MDLGAPTSHLLATKGLPVFSSERAPVGEVQVVLADEAEDIFDGLVIETSIGGGGPRFVDAADVEEFYEQGVLLRLTTTQCGRLYRPEPAPAALEARGDEPPPGPLRRKLQRAWELVSGEG